MSDRLTQLQDCLDQFLVQMFATIRYIDTHHSYAHIQGQIDQFEPPPDYPAVAANTQLTQPSSAAHPLAVTTSQATQQQQPPAAQDQIAIQQPQPQQEVEPISSKNPEPHPPTLFTQRLSELAQDLVLKEQQIEALVAALPGIGSSQEAQEARLRELDVELKKVEAEREKWIIERERLAKTLDGWIVGGVRRV
jgi:mediator of RNA polymerase II transcription subunit 21